MTPKDYADAIARQAILVETLGMQNIAPLSYAERVTQQAQYEMARAELAALRQSLVDLVLDAAMNPDLATIRSLNTIH